MQNLDADTLVISRPSSRAVKADEDDLSLEMYILSSFNDNIREVLFLTLSIFTKL